MIVIYFATPRTKTYYPNWQKMANEILPMTLQKPIAGKIPHLEGLALDFNSGLRLQIPKGQWHVKIQDFNTKTVLFDNDIQDAILVSCEKFYIKWEVEVYLQGHLMLHHVYDCEGRNVHFKFEPTGMGDHINIMTAIETFRRIHKCKAFVEVPDYLKDLFKTYYPKIKFNTPPLTSYATYIMTPTFHPFIATETARTMSGTRAGIEILDLYFADKVIFTPTKSRQIKEPYVVIASQASSAVKAWLNPQGYDQVVAYLKKIGYRVLCIDLKKETSDHGFTAKIPNGAEDFTGNIPLLERVNQMAYADFFIGFSSGLSWLAWAVDIPVILVSGFTASWYDADNTYRVYNKLLCRGCHNNALIPWNDIYNCPMLKGSPRQYECSRMISSQQVINAIDAIRNKLYK